MKKCKYCQSNIDENAKICPNCRKDLRWGNNPLWLIPIITILIIFIYFYLSPNAPTKVREVICGLGLRDGYPYCYKYVWEK